MRDYSLSEVLRTAMDGHTLEMYTCLPGRVLAFHRDRQTVDVACTVKDPRADELGQINYFDLPSFADVPIAYPRGGGFMLAFPLRVGDPVALVFATIGAGEYLDTGEDAEPRDARRHSLGYPVAIPGGFSPTPKALADASASDLVIGIDGDDRQIHVSPSGGIQLGKGASEFVALSDKVDAAITTLVNAIDVLNAALTAGIPVITVSGAMVAKSAAPLPPVSPPPSVAATLVQAK